MLRFSDPEEQIVAVLHDVIEDSGLTSKRLRNLGYSKAIVEAIDFLTRRELETYSQFINRIKEGPDITRKVKLADLIDNSNLERINNPTETDHTRRRKYMRAIQRLS